MYADDTAIISSSVDLTYVIRYLQEHSDALLEYFSDRKINSSKTDTIYFSRRRRRSPSYLSGSQIDVNGVSIPWAPKVKYLGLINDKKSIFRDHRGKVYILIKFTTSL
jgi:hypothetical protein